MTLTEQLNEILLGLRSSIPEIKGSLIASTDGMTIAANLPGGDANRMAAMVATALGLGKRICETFGGGTLNETSVTGSEGQVYIYSAGSKGVLAVIAGKGANVGLINIECRDGAEQIQKILA
jgi:uncharacterized protein